MSSVVHDTPFNRRLTDRMPSLTRRTTDRPQGAVVAPLRAEGIRVSWGSIVGGVLLAVGLLVLLTSLGAAIGITAADPNTTEASTAGRAAGIFGAIALLLALFFGGWAATRIGAISDRATAFSEGALVWIVSILLVVGLAATGLSTLVGGAMNLASTASQVTGENASAGSSSQMIEQAKEKIGGVMDQAKSGEAQQKAAEAKPAAQKGAWITFGALVLSLLAAVAGAMSGRREPLQKLRD